VCNHWAGCDFFATLFGVTVSDLAHLG